MVVSIVLLFRFAALSICHSAMAAASEPRVDAVTLEADDWHCFPDTVNYASTPGDLTLPLAYKAVDKWTGC
jgi:hypothetical protein